MKKKKTKIFVIVLALVVFIAVLANIIKSKPLEAGMDPFAPIEVQHIVERGSIEVAVTGSSSVTPTDKRTVRSEINGSVDSIYVTEGDFVEKDQVLVSLKSSSEGDNKLQIRDIDLNISKVQKELNDLYNNRGDLSIYAEASGVVSNINIEVGDVINSNFNIGTIKDTGNSYIEVYFLKEAYENINIGDSVDIFMPEYFTRESGSLYDKDSSPIQMGSGLFGYRVTVKMKNPGGYSLGDLAQVTVSNSNGTYEGMANGEIVQPKSINIISKVAGEIKSVNVENGENIEEGTLIALIEEGDIEHKIAEKQNQVERYKSQREDLLEGDTIYSPMKGTILQINVSEEEVVDRTTTLMTLADLDKMKAVIAVDELDITKVELGQIANISCDVFPDEKFIGKVDKISLEGLNQGGVTTYDLTIELDDRKGLMSGMNVDIEIIFERRENVLIVPIDALHRSDGQYLVTVKDDSGEKIDKSVELGLVTEDEVEILRGLNEGDIIIYNKIRTQINPFENMTVEAGSGGGRPRGNNND